MGYKYDSEIVLVRIKNNMVNGENADYQRFLPFSQCFQKDFFLRLVKCPNCVTMGYAAKESKSLPLEMVPVFLIHQLAQY